MRRHILLIRHAKAASEPSFNDFDRPLTARGKSDSHDLAQWLTAQHAPCGAAYVSSAKRTQETWQQLAQHWNAAQAAPVKFSESLYLASAGDLLDWLQSLPDAQTEVVLVGHNSGLHQLAILLCQPKLSTHFHQLEMAFPTASCAWFTLELEQWRDLAPQSAQLQQLWQPDRQSR